MTEGSSACEPRTYVLDANVFVAAYRQYYAPNFCPGFWECLSHYANQRRLSSIDRVRSELLYPDGLVEWVDQVADVMFMPSTEKGVVQTFAEMQRWVQQSDQFSQAAEDEFARVADGWLGSVRKGS